MRKKYPWRNVVINEDVSILEATKVLNEGHLRIVLIIDKDFHLVGVISDSDIRRAVLNRISFEKTVCEIMVRSPVIAFTSNTDEEILELMKRTTFYEIPILDRNGKLVGLKCMEDILEPEPINNLVVIMAGGLGERLHPHTKVIPKPLIKIGDKPVLFILLDRLIECGFNNFVISISYKGEMIKKAVLDVEEYAPKVKFIEEEKRLGTAGALHFLEEKPDKSFLVINADLLTHVDYRAMLRLHSMENNDITIGIKEGRFQIPYGVVDLNSTKIVGLQEKPEHTYFINSGIYILNHDIIDGVPCNQFYDMTTMINEMSKNGKQIGSFPVHEYWLDIGTPEELLKAKKDYPIHF